MNRAGPGMAVLALTLCLGACVSARSTVGGDPGSAVTTNPQVGGGTIIDRPVPAAVLDLPLVDSAGGSLTLGSLAGKTVVLTDFLTTCQEICPLTSVNFRKIADALAATGRSSPVVLVEATVDPDRDTPSRLAAYEALYGARPGWKFVTADAADIASLWKFFGIGYSKQDNAEPLPTDWFTDQPLTYDVTHQDAVFIVDGSGHERWFVVGNPSTAGAPPPPTMNSFLNDEGQQNLASPEPGSWTNADVEAALAWLAEHSTTSGSGATA
ncbi:MAG: SCO family protein [Cellulomonas sp.]